MRKLNVVEEYISVNFKYILILVIELYYYCFYVKLCFKFKKVVRGFICILILLLVLGIYYFRSN